MAFIKEVVLATLFTAIAFAQLPAVPELPAAGGLPVNQSVPALPETPIGNTSLPVAVPDTNGTVPVDTGMATVPSVPGQETTEAPSRLMNAINTIGGRRGNRGH